MGHRDYDSYNNTGKDDSEFQFTLSPDIWLSADDIKANESEFSFFPSDEPKPEPKRRRRRKKKSCSEHLCRSRRHYPGAGCGAAADAPQVSGAQQPGASSAAQ